MTSVAQCHNIHMEGTAMAFKSYIYVLDNRGHMQELGHN